MGDEKGYTPTDEDLKEMEEGLSLTEEEERGALVGPSYNDVDIFYDHTLCFFRSKETNLLTAALAKARAEFQPLDLSGKVDFTNNKNQRVKYEYATKDDMLAASVLALSKYGIVFQTLVTSEMTEALLVDQVHVRASLKHESGQEEGAYLSQRVVTYEKQQTSDFLKCKAAAATYLIRMAYPAIVGLGSVEPDYDGMTVKEKVAAEAGELSEEKNPSNQVEMIDYTRANVLEVLAAKAGYNEESFGKYLLDNFGSSKRMLLAVQDADTIETILVSKIKGEEENGKQ